MIEVIQNFEKEQNNKKNAKSQGQLPNINKQPLDKQKESKPDESNVLQN